MKLWLLVVTTLACALAQEPETKELFVNRRKINLVNNVIHGTVRKILFPFGNKIPRTFTKHTRTYSGSHPSTSYPTGSLPPASYPSYPGSESPYQPSHPILPIPSSPHLPDPIPYPTYPTYPQPSGVVPSQTPTGSLTLDEVLAGDDRFTTLVAALAVAFDKNADVLNGTSPLTIFAPTNSAFAKVGNETLDGLLKDPDALSGVLQRHLVGNKAVRIPDGTTTLETLDGGSLTVSRTIDDIFSEGVSVQSPQGRATIVELDIQASDGVIHAIDTVL